MHERVFFLKVFTDKYFTLSCIQFWLNLAEAHGAYLYIICEKEDLIKKIRTKCYYRGTTIAQYEQNERVTEPLFLAARFHDLKTWASSVVVHSWVSACISHLTTFLIAKEKGIKYFWNIDADDTYFIHNCHDLSRAFSEVERKCQSENIDALSLDMWNTQSNHKHWSFGVVYTKNLGDKDYFEIIEKNTQEIHTAWDKDSLPPYLRNIDWFFTYLNKKGYLNLKTFYVDNVAFVHYGMFSGEYCPGSLLCYWSRGKLFFPFISKKDGRLNELSCSNDAFVVDLEVPSLALRQNICSDRERFDFRLTDLDINCIFSLVFRAMLYKLLYAILPFSQYRSKTTKKYDHYRLKLEALLSKLCRNSDTN